MKAENKNRTNVLYLLKDYLGGMTAVPCGRATLKAVNLVWKTNLKTFKNYHGPDF